MHYTLVTLRNVGIGQRRMRQFVKKTPAMNTEESFKLLNEQYPGYEYGERKLGVIVWENAVARMPLSRELFNGPYDERWGIDGEEQRIVFCGEKLAPLCEDQE